MQEIWELIYFVRFICSAAEAAKALRKALRDKSALRQMNAITETNPQVKLYLLERLASWASVCSTDPGLGIIPGLYNNLVYDQVVPFYDAGAPTKSPISDHITRPNVAAAQCNLPTLPLTYAEVVTHTVLVKNNCRMLTEIVTFTDPDTVGKDEFKLIQEFKKSVMALQRDTQMYLNEATSRSDFDAVAMSQLLYANEDIVNSIKCYNDLMEKLHVKHSLTTSRQNSISTETQAPLSHQTSFPPTSQHSIRTPLDEMQVGVISDDNGGAGVGSGYIQDTSDLRSGKATMLSTSPLTSSVIPTVSEPALNPFADDSYYVTESESDNIATTIRNGKRPIQKEDPITKVEEDLIQLVKAHSLTSANRMTVASSSSSSSSTAAAAGSTAVVSS
ncbi:hypothetical protein FBU30_006905 [Linnemannia zychae]|nr:hypothetical protein FBU30_006905 [Linnemannia zychae]